ncbi:MAG: SpoIIE family protein phosphatase [Methylococcaceae bacterium]|nr:SpoIIE family protein phosphatase [Methylococcaceae bacterium]MCI0733305.1 SpoIIE family protein phosphatase [Methylococcaceae bacterium]
MVDFFLIFQIVVENVRLGIQSSPVITGVNPAFNQLLGYTTDEITGKSVKTLFFSAGDTRKFHRAIVEKVLTHRVIGGLDINLKTRQGEKFPVHLSISPIYHGNSVNQEIVCIARDTAQTESFERALMESEERFRQMADMTGEWLWEQDPSGQYIYSSAAVTNILGYSPEEVIGKNYSELFTESSRLKFSVEIERKKIGRFFNLLNQYRHRDGHVISTESTGVPILDRNGVLIKWRGVDRDITERRRVEEEIRKAHVKLAVAHHEMKIARRIQESLLPSGPLIVPGVRVEGYCLPADQVGGDYFDYFCRDNGTVDVVIADVSGHAVGPALFMVETRSALRTQTQMISEPGETLFLMNRFLYHDLSQSDHFITMFYLQYNCATRKIRYSNAGHNPPLLMRRGSDSCQTMDAEGLVLGVKDVVCFDQKEQTLEPGDLVFLYTDGLTEAQGPDGEFFGTGRLCRLLSDHSHLSADQLMDVCVAELKSFRKTDTFTDDLTMVVLNVTDEVLD